jgi:hypothetical protein
MTLLKIVFSGHANVVFVRTESNLETEIDFRIQTSPRGEWMRPGLWVGLKSWFGVVLKSGSDTVDGKRWWRLTLKLEWLWNLPEFDQNSSEVIRTAVLSYLSVTTTKPVYIDPNNTISSLHLSTVSPTLSHSHSTHVRLCRSPRSDLISLCKIKNSKTWNRDKRV